MTYPLMMLAQAAPARDTVVMVVARDGLAVAVDVATVILAVALLLVALMVLGGLLTLRRGAADVGRWVRGLRSDPALSRGRDLVENLEVITSSLRSDVARLSGSVEKLAGRVDQASDRMEERIEDFNALLEVVQEEAEDAFVHTASRMRGARATARALGKGSTRRRTGTDLPAVTDPPAVADPTDPGPPPAGGVPGPAPAPPGDSDPRVP